VLYSHQDETGTGSALYAGGRITSAGGVPVNNIAKWDGTEWSALGGGLVDGGGAAVVEALKMHDDGSGAGPALYVGGYFDLAGGRPAVAAARWDGDEWTPVGGGLPHLPSVTPEVYAIDVYDDGRGPALYFAGKFTGDGGRAVTRWDGRIWSALDEGLSEGSPAGILVVFCMTVFDNDHGPGPGLYLGGTFGQAGSIASKQIARWQGCAPALSCASDLNGDRVTDIADLLLILAAWGPCKGCPEDLTGDDVVDLNDLLALLSAWGPCP